MFCEGDLSEFQDGFSIFWVFFEIREEILFCIGRISEFIQGKS
jgi:hypothetical protein